MKPDIEKNPEVAKFEKSGPLPRLQRLPRSPRKQNIQSLQSM